ncbi:hypothetical protein AXF42_Ash012907 [Apostasia shenzhenica]|uniref:Uncharacterized protein n=1 Tax=Apostasia shenzhenica TaxID=1088818 RepID=A0A2I0ARK9_9ASPA|nr:hypothetical protein AXF42_Ash012907 [Apostasia shenzhenica]
MNPNPFSQAILRTMEKDGSLEQLMAASECSSGCHSGWTFYLDSLQRRTGVSVSEDEGEDESDDSSMLSDASSGPPHVNEDEQLSLNAVPVTRRAEEKQQKHASAMDDTASSPVFPFSEARTFTTYSN